MTEFFVGCVGILSDTFNAAMQLSYFRFYSACIAMAIAYGLFLLMKRTAKVR